LRHHSVPVRRAVTAGLLTSALAMASVLVAPAALADSYKIAYFDPQEVPVTGQKLPGGQLTGAVEGHGTRIDVAGGDFVAAGTICAWYVEVVLIDPDGEEYDWFHGETHDCSHVGIDKYDMGRLEMEDHSTVEVRLMADNGRTVVAKTVHDIEEYKPWYRW
jgi:hypothetical protein